MPIADAARRGCRVVEWSYREGQAKRGRVMDRPGRRVRMTHGRRTPGARPLVGVGTLRLSLALVARTCSQDAGDCEGPGGSGATRLLARALTVVVGLACRSPSTSATRPGALVTVVYHPLAALAPPLAVTAAAWARSPTSGSSVGVVGRRPATAPPRCA